MRLIDANKFGRCLNIMNGRYGKNELMRIIIKFYKDLLDTVPSIDIVRCGECKHRPVKEDADGENYGFNLIKPNDGDERCPCLVSDGWYSWMPEDDFYCGYGERDSEKPNNCERITEDGVTCAKYPACDDCLDNPLNKVKGSERLLKGKDEPQTERIKTLDYCDICNHKGCDNCIANNLDDYCVPSGYEPITKTEIQNSNLTFEKRTMWDCYNCKRYETEGECIECHYEPKTEPQTDCGDFADRLAYERGVKHAWEVAQKVFDSTVTFYEAEDVAKQIDKLQTERSE